MNYFNLYPELKNVHWADLVRVKKLRVIWEILLPLPFLLLCFILMSNNHFNLALIPTFFFFLTGLRLSHNAQHYIVGCSKKSCELILFFLSPLMMNSMHAVQVTHLRHHKLCLEPEDEEGHCAHMPFYKALFYGPLFTINMHRNALKYGTQKQRNWIYLELSTELILLVYALTAGHLFLQLFVLVMLAANCLTAFFCVWLVHYACDGKERVSRTMRNRFINILSFNMFLHVEHHLFPQVPTYNLLKLAKRIDKETDSFKENLVF